MAAPSFDGENRRLTPPVAVAPEPCPAFYGIRPPARADRQTASPMMGIVDQPVEEVGLDHEQPRFYDG
jgi:hypothetical protein